MEKEDTVPKKVEKYQHSIPEIRRFYETTSLSIVFLTFFVVCISIVDLDNLLTFTSIGFLALAALTFALFIFFSIGLVWNRVTDLYNRAFERPKELKFQIFLNILWIAIATGFLVALFSESVQLPTFLVLPAKILAIIWGIYVIIALFVLKTPSSRKNS